MTNIFENAYFGKPYKTRDGEMAMYIRAGVDEYGRTYHDLETADYTISARCDGTERFAINESSEDIVGEWNESVTDEYVTDFAQKLYPDNNPITNLIMKEMQNAFIKGYNTAKTQVEKLK